MKFEVFASEFYTFWPRMGKPPELRFIGELVCENQTMQLLPFPSRAMCIGWIEVGTWLALLQRQAHQEGMGEDDLHSDCVECTRKGRV